MKFILQLIIMSLVVTIVDMRESAGISPHADSRYGGRLVMGTTTVPTGIHPLYTTHSISASLQELIFNKLARLNARGEFEPDLAERWTVSPDGLTHTFYLRRGVRFHDGAELTAEDVKFTYDALRDPKNESPQRGWFESVQEIRVVDRYTVEVVLSKPSASFMMWFANEIVPKHLLEGTDLRRSAFQFRPVGSGPFRFKSWANDDTVTLEFNPDYYEGRPYLDEIVVKVFPDSTELWGALMRGAVDYAGFLEQDDYEVVRKDSTFRAYAIPSDGYYALVYNLRDPLLADIRVRQAIARGIDRDNLILRVASGHGAKCDGPFQPDSIGFDPSVQPIAYDPDEARRLFAEAGWRDADYDGLLEKDGRKLTLTMLADGRSDVNKRIAMVLRQQLQVIGVQVLVMEYRSEEELPEAFHADRGANSHLKFIAGGMFPAQLAIDWDSRYLKRNGVLQSYVNTEVNRLFDEGDYALSPNQQKIIYTELYRRIVADQPACFLFYPKSFFAVSSRLRNTDDFWSAYMPVYTMAQWYRDTQGRR